MGGVVNLEEAIKSADKAITHLESLCRNISSELSIQEKRNYTNEIYDDIELFDRFKQNAIIILCEARTLPQTEIALQVTPMNISLSTKKNLIRSEQLSDFTYTFVEKIIFCGNEYHVKNWAETLVAVVEMVVSDRKITASILTNNINLKGKKRAYFSNDVAILTRAYQLSNGCYLELNFSAKQIYKLCYLMINEFGYEEDDLVIVYSKKTGYVDESLPQKQASKDVLDIKEISKEAYDDPVKMLEELGQI